MRMLGVSVCLFIVLQGFSANAVWGSGGFICDNPAVAVSAPNRTVATVHAGDTQTVLVTADMRADRLANLAWIVPIETDNRPVAMRVSSNIFSEIRGLARDAGGGKWVAIPIFDPESTISGLAKLQDPRLYDIQVLGPGPAPLREWLEANGLSGHAALDKILSPDVPREAFFIVVYLGLARSQKENIDFVNSQSWLSDANTPEAKAHKALEVFWWQQGRGSLYDRVAREILLKEPYEGSEISRSPLNREYGLITKAEYDTLVQQYGMPREILLRTFPFAGRAPRFIDLWFRQDNREITFHNGRERDVVVFKRDKGSTGKHYGWYSDEPVYSEAELEEVRGFFATYGPLLQDRSEELSSLLRDKLRDHPTVQRFDALDDALIELKNGLLVSLKITFGTTDPRIPSAVLDPQGEDANVTVYVFDGEPLKDRDDRLQIVKWKKLGTDAKITLSQFLPAYDAHALSVLSYSGVPSGSDRDITFSEMDAEQKAIFSEEGLAKARERAEEMRGAIHEGDLDGVKKQVALGERVDGDHGGRLVSLAAEQASVPGHPTKEIIEYLLANGANINTLNNRGETPLYCAIYRCWWSHADRGFPVIQMLIDRGGDLGGKNLDQLDAGLLVAAVRAHVTKVMTFLVEHGLKTEDARSREKTALFVAAETGNVEAVEFLIGLGVNIDAPCVPSTFEMVPIEGAAREGHLAVVRLLLEHRAWPGKALSMAAEGGHLDVVEYLLSRNLDVNDSERSATTPLWYAAQAGHVEIVKVLLEKGADPAMPCHRGEPITAAAEAGHLDVIRHLLAHGANVDGESRGSATPLWRAAKAGHKEIVKLLLESGADVTRFSERRTPAQVAAVSGHRDIAVLIRSYENRP